ncbi:MAG: amino acid adenylation domain-containing protein [Propionibacteriaceae bacterium]|nr:amino acid adenylation domain-containing protein [Propionibacteriaceae bacterium]
MSNHILPMSPAQQGMFFDCQLRQAADYHIVVDLDVEPVDYRRLVQAVEAMIAEQPALRAAIVESAAGPSYAIADTVPAPVTHHDFTADDTDLEAVMMRARHTPFQLDTAPLFRVLAVATGDGMRLVIVCHHLIADGQSASILAERILGLARGTGEIFEPQLDQGMIVYQEDQVLEPTPQVRARRESYWTENIARHETPQLGHWLASAPREDIAREYRLSLPATLNQKVCSAARDAEVSEFTVYLAAFGVLLSRYSGQEQISFGSPFTDRPHLEMDSSIGCFIRTLPVRIDAAGSQTVVELLAGTRTEIMDLWRNLDYPVTQMLSRLPSVNLFDITFIHDAYPRLPEGVRSMVRPDEVHFPGVLTVTVEQLGDSTDIVVWYKESALPADSVALFAQRLLHLIGQIADDIHAPVASLCATDAVEQAELLESARGTHHFDWTPTDLGTLFLERTTSDPAAPTWVDENRSYSNAWVHDAAVLVQHRLLRTVDDRTPVAILLPRGAALLAAVFGSVLAGRAYVPLSEHMPAGRIAGMLADADVRTVLTYSAASLELPEGVVRVNVDDCPEIAVLADDTRTIIQERASYVDRTPEDLLYIEYTSGSTGHPKGVAITHANVQNTALDLERRFPLGADDVFLLKTSFTFDIFGTEVYGWLVGAGMLAVLPVGQEADPSAVISAVRRFQVTHLNTSPTLLRVLLASARSRANDLRSLRYLFVGGEALTADIINQFFALNLSCTLENVYGPTEATMWATHTRISAQDAVDNVPIGVPLNDYRIHILDRQGELCGVDLPGEVCIVGAGVGAGYLNQEDLNARQFVPNPLFNESSDPDVMRRMYRTGDLGYLRSDGRFAFLRRMDRQVKVGGLRVELGEIERAMLGVPGIVEAAALVDESMGEPRLVGFYAADSEISPEQIRAALGTALITQFIPSVLIQVEALPTSAAGKLNRAALRELIGRPEAPTAQLAVDAVADRIAALWQKVLGRPITDRQRTFFESGGTSLSLMRLQIEMQDTLGVELSITDLLSHPTIAAQTSLIKPAEQAAPVAVRSDGSQGADIAIIGVGIQVPGAADVHSFWDLLVSRRESITFYDNDELRALGVEETLLRDPAYVRAAGRIEGVDTFDDRLFGLSPAEVDVTSPQLRLLYECFWLACEDAGYDPQALPGRVGVFAAGSDDFTWYQRTLMNGGSFGDAYQNFTLATNHFLSTRLSYHFDLTGPSLSALTGCSSSLMTVHLAVQALRTGECDMAVAGGVTVELPNSGGYQWVDGMMLSRDGHCRPFDAAASGTVFSNGAALLVLKPLAMAVRDEDPIYAVIKGSASGNDGRRKQSYTAPSEDGQYETISTAYRTANIPPESVSFIEAHGTGTPLGDPIEVASLTRAFAEAPRESCLLGSVKGNIGHTDSAAGAVGLAKVALSLKHRLLPGTVNFATPNPHVDFPATPFEVSSENRTLEAKPLRAGINSFGVGGTNVHMILEEAPALPSMGDEETVLLQFSGATADAATRTAERVIQHIVADPTIRLADVATTLRSRTELPHRATLVVRGGEARDAAAWLERLVVHPTHAQAAPRRAFMFSGQGNQYHRMGYGLLTGTGPAASVYQRWMEQLIALLPSADADEFRDVVWGGVDDGRIHRTEWSQYALFSTQIAVAKVLESFGIVPDVMVGHSIGELTAATLAGVWSLEDAAMLVRERGRLMQAQPPGVMVAALASASEAAAAVADLPEAWLALENSPQRSVIGVAPQVLNEVLTRLDEAGIVGVQLQTSHAFHTPMMAAAADAFAATVARVTTQEPSIPIVSDRTGELVRPGQMTDPTYWGDHITGTVRFAESIATLLTDGPLVAIETGPGNSLATFVSQCDGGDVPVVGVLRHAAAETSDETHLLAALGAAWAAGLPIDWTSQSTGRRVSLPGYSFDQSPHPVSGGATLAVTTEPNDPISRSIPAGRVDAIREAYRRVLGHSEVAPSDDFFALGGDSLKATGLTAHLKTMLGVDVTVADVFAASTPEALADRLPQRAVTAAMSKAPLSADHPLSAAQERMYLASRFAPDSPAYNMASVTLLDGHLDHVRVRSALERLVRRHEPLRTVFSSDGGQVRQRVVALTDLPLTFSRGTATAESAATHLERFIRPFDLDTGPLFRMEIVEDAATSLLLFDVHHIVADATSAEILARDFGQLYEHDLEPPALQYVDYVHHLRTVDVSAELIEAEDALLTRLDTPPSPDVLPLDHPRGEHTPAAGRIDWTIRPELAQRIAALAEQHQATLSMVLLASWGAVFSRYSGTEDLVIGTPGSARTAVETREMVGMFVNMLPVRLTPRGDTSFADYLRGTREVVLDSLAALDVPFEHVVDRLGVQRIPGRHPLCDVSFDFHNIEHHDLHIGGLAARQIETVPLAVGMDLVITGRETASGIHLQFDYAADLFNAETIEALARHFDAFLQHACADPSAPTGQISIYSEAEHDEWRARLTGAPFTPLHDLIARRAGQQPEAVAVIDGEGGNLTFAQLNLLADAVAARLVTAGLKVGDPVVLVTERSANLLIAQLAISKAGGAYVPLDPTQPADRHARILEDINPRFAIAPAGFAATTSVATVLDLNSCDQGGAASFDAPTVTADDPVYVVYTSGSTGRPKGIAVKHGGLANLFQDHQRRSIFEPGDVIISLADPTFDIFAFESLIPLAAGATIHLCPTRDQKDAGAVAGRIAAHNVSHIQVPVSKMAAFCGNRRFRAQLPQLRVIVCGGEHFSENLVELLHESTSARVFNMYGPTETTVTTTVKELAPGDAVTIGSPIFGSHLLVVSDAGMALPAGVPGELCVAGQGLARGYVNRPDETRRAFTTLPELPDVPVYRTGDVGALLPNGEIALKGRTDHQVKVNGNRIELGEIEQVAMRADGVTYAVALVENDDIVCYFTAEETAGDPAASIRSAIAAALPKYMTPRSVQQVPEMPRLPNNKIDRSALGQQPEAPRPPSPEPARAANTLDVITGVWEQVLQHPVAPNDNFFDIGGSSFKLMLVSNRLNEALDADIPLVQLFEYPTPRALATSLGAADTVAEPEPAEADFSLQDLAHFEEWQDETSTSTRIAVVGVAGHLPGAGSVTEHWNNRAAGIVSIRRFTRDELRASGVAEPLLDHPDYVPARGHIAADTFDTDLFAYSRRDAEAMDPQARILHETAWHALEDAGYDPRQQHGNIALFAGSGTNFAWVAGLLSENTDPMAAFEALTSNEKDFLATRVAYKLNLTGPAVTVQTACSTSLVAIHEAVACLRRGEADMALAGGVALNFPRAEGYLWQDGMIFSRDGVCRPFSADADGTVAGQGCGLVLLKPLDAALRDGDHIYAVIAGTAINNDGDAKVGYTAPGVKGQERVIRAALADAGVDADEIDFVETHGTGTAMGDPIEYAALSEVYGQDSPCALGAVKANIGHLDAAAGIAGFLGAVGVLHRQQIPPMANFTKINQAIQPTGNLYVPVGAAADTTVRKAAVSSFGIGGTNAHIILEQAPIHGEDLPELDGAVVLGVSALTDESRLTMQRDVERALADGVSLRDAAYTLVTGRAQFDRRAAAVTRTGRYLEWVETGAPAVVADASDDVALILPPDLEAGDTLAAEILAAVGRWLSRFDAAARKALEAALSGAATDRSAERVAQFIIRAAILSAVGNDCLTARAGQDRLVRIARAYAAGTLDAGAALTQLRSRNVTIAPLEAIPGARIVKDPLSSDLLRTLLASEWVRGGQIGRDHFHRGGRRIPLPGYAFAQQHLLSDVRLDRLFDTPNQVTETADVTPDVLRQAWVQVIGTDPADSDSFLASGGDSLAAVRLCSLIKERAGVTITVRDIFAAPTFGALKACFDADVCLPVAAQPASVATAGVFPASPAQRNIYAACSMQDASTAYNLAIGYQVTGPLDVARLRLACAALVARHDQLRASFHLEGSEVTMHVTDEVADVVAHEHVTRDEAARRMASEPKPFDLAQAPLFRVEVLSVDESEHYLRLDLHHIVGDQSSLAILGQDLADAWAGRDLDVVPATYAQCAAQLQERAASGELDQDVAFFTKLLADSPGRINLPCDHTPPQDATFAGARQTIYCSASKESIAQLAAAADATPYAVFLTAVARVLGLHSGQREFVVGTALSGRTTVGSQQVVGMFVNSLPMRLSADAHRGVREAIRETRNHIAEVLSHQDAPLDRVLAASGITVTGQDHPLFDVLVSFVTMGTNDLDIEGLTLRALPPGVLRSRFPLSFSIAEHGDRYSVELEYRTELFDAATIARLAAHLDHLLVGMTADAERDLALVPCESDAEFSRRRAALTGRNTPIETGLDAPLRESFIQHRDLIALRWEGQEWTYGQVDELTSRLAGGLQAAGICSGDIVATILDRGPWQVWSRLALARMGAIELPLDPEAPAQRIEQMLSDAGAIAALAGDPSRQDLPSGLPAFDPAELTGYFQAPRDLVPTSPLIMIYTSGTTGQPKGVLVTHGGILSACVDTGYLDAGPGDRVLHLTRHTFDPSMLDIYSSMLTGATLIMGSHAHNMDMCLLAQFLRSERVTKGLLITAVFHLLMAEDPQAIVGMTALYVGGEAMQPWAAQRAWEVLGAGRLFNIYGPTEVSICSTFFRVDEYPSYERMPIGGPTHNRELFVVDAQGTDLPCGVPGELCIAGPALALGYHRREELTAERFPENLGGLGKRVYRTGDKVVLDDQYRIIYLDRVDRQVKHAGYRIELSEIENVMQRHAGVTEAVVLHTTTEENDSRLLGFYTGDATAEELRGHLLQALPTYMVPQHLTSVAEFPLTRHGKVDRAQLLTLGADARPVLPETADDTVDDLLGLARSVFALPDLAPDANFLTLGIQSIQAIALARRLRECGFDAQVSDIYRYPSVAELRSILSVPLQAPPVGRATPAAVDCERIVADIVADARDLADAFASDAPSYRFEAGILARFHTATGSVGGCTHTVQGVQAPALREALGDLVAAHEMLRARVSGDWFDVIPEEAVADLADLVRIHDLSALAAEQATEITDAIARDLTRAPFEGGLLWRVAMVLEPTGSIRLTWAFHHSIFDGFSARLLSEELVRRSRGLAVPAAQPYSDFLRQLDGDHNWAEEFAGFDYDAWLTSNEVVTGALALDPLPSRVSLPLNGDDPLGQALREVHAQLSGVTCEPRVSVGIVSDCRHWRGRHYGACVGEFLDVVPVTLTGLDDQPLVSQRLASARERGLHYLHALANLAPTADQGVARLRGLYHGGDTLGLVLVNFQGHIPPADVPSGDLPGLALAAAQVNIWYDDSQLHLQWITAPAPVPTEAIA